MVVELEEVSTKEILGDFDLEDIERNIGKNEILNYFSIDEIIDFYGEDKIKKFLENKDL